MHKHNDTLQDIIDECARIRGCHSLLNRTNAEFCNWLMTEKRIELVPLAIQFRNHCKVMYSGDQ